MKKHNRHFLLTSVALLAGHICIGSTAAYAQSSASAYTSAVRYDALGRVVGTVAPDPDGAGPLNFAAVRNTYDSSGNLIKVETGELSAWQSEAVLPANWTGFTILSTLQSTYDAVGKKLSDLAKGSDLVSVSLTQYSYTVAGDLECTAVRMNQATFASPPASACTLGTAGSNGNDRITRNVYTLGAPGQVQKVQRAVGTALQQDYATYTYSGNWKSVSMTDARGLKASMTYDGFDRQTKWNFPDKVYAQAVSATDYEEYAYDANGNRTSLRKRDGSTLTFQFDALGRNTVKVVPERAGLAATHSRDVYYGYDLRGLQTYARFDWAGGEGVTNAFDGFGRLASTTLTMDGAARNLSFLHDLNNNRWRVAHADGNYFDYAFDGLNRMFYGNVNNGALVLHNVFTNRGQRIWQFSGGYTSTAYYGYDAIGRLNVLTQDIAGTTYDVSYGFGFNPANQMTSRSASNDAYAFAGSVNVSRPYTVNGLNQYMSAGSATFTYDANGNLTGDGSSAYLYDVENRLVSASGATSASLRYDPLGRLYETSGGPAGTTRFLYDRDELVAEYNSAGTMLRRYVHGSGADDPMAWFEGASVDASVAKLIKTDHQGSVIALTDWNGNLAAINSYDEWGIPANNNIGRFQYTGQAWIPELKMYHYKARIYSPTLGRFLQTDPIGYADQSNLYGYVGNDPINKTDPTGLFGCEKTMSSSQCNSFKNAQSQLARALSGKIALLTSLQSKVSSGGSLSTSQKQAAGLLEKYMGKGSGNNASQIGKLIGVAQGALRDLNSAKPASFVSGSSIGGDAGRTEQGGISVSFNQDLFTPAVRRGLNTPAFKDTLMHEAIHSGSYATIRDWGTYGSVSSAARAERETNNYPGKQNYAAENYLYALGLAEDQ